MMSCNTPSIDQTNEAVELSFFFYGYSIFQSFKLNLWRLGRVLIDVFFSILLLLNCVFKTNFVEFNNFMNFK